MFEILGLLYKQDKTFLDNDLKKVNFSSFIGAQYSRTLKMQQNMQIALSSLELKYGFAGRNVDFKKIGKVISLLFIDIIGNWIYSNSKIFFLQNNTEIDYITGDQPIVNIKAKDLSYMEPPTQFEIYYPITPKLAILISEKCDYNNEIEPQLVKFFNNIIIEKSYEQYYAREKNYLVSK